MKSGGASLTLVDLTKNFGSVCAVDNVSIDVQEGEFLALLGPSGSGKTTILTTIAGFEKPTSGTIVIDRRPITSLPPYRREIGMVFQKYALFPHLSVADNIAFPLRMRRVPAKERATRVEEALELVRMGGYGSRRSDQLSGGQQQRVALARAIVYRPPVLLMDEPLGALDRKLREHMQLELKHLQRKLGTTVLYVTHDQGEALTMADRVAVLNEGRLQQLGRPEELYERPANAFVADFVGETNFLDGRLISREGEVAQVVLGPGAIVHGALSPGAEPPDGASVRVAVRPERVLCRTVNFGANGGCAGVVEETVYEGASLAVIVRLEFGAVIKARLSTQDREAHWQPGDALEVHWQPEDGRIYARDAS